MLKQLNININKKQAVRWSIITLIVFYTIFVVFNGIRTYGSGKQQRALQHKVDSIFKETKIKEKHIEILEYQIDSLKQAYNNLKINNLNKEISIKSKYNEKVLNIYKLPVDSAIIRFSNRISK